MTLDDLKDALKGAASTGTGTSLTQGEIKLFSSDEFREHLLHSLCYCPQKLLLALAFSLGYEAGKLQAKKELESQKLEDLYKL